MQGKPSTKKDIVDALVKLHLSGVELRSNAIAEADPHLFFALYNNEQSGGRKYKSLTHARIDVSEKLRRMERYDDSSAVLRLNLTSKGSTGFPEQKKQEIRNNLIDTLIAKKNAGEDLTYRSQQKIDRSFAGKAYRYFEGWPNFLKAAHIDPTDVQKMQKLPLEAYLCILYDMYLQSHPLDGPSVQATAPSLHPILARRCHGYYNALGTLEKLLNRNAMISDAIKCSPQYWKAKMKSQRALEKEIAANAPSEKPVTIDAKQPYGWHFFNRFGLDTPENIVGGQVIIAHLRHSSDWFTPEQVALHAQITASAVCKYKIPKVITETVQINENGKKSYLISKRGLEQIKKMPHVRHRGEKVSLQDIARDLCVPYSVARRHREKLHIGVPDPLHRNQYVFSEQEEISLRRAIASEQHETTIAMQKYIGILETRSQWTPAQLARDLIPATHFYNLAKKNNSAPTKAFPTQFIIRYFKSIGNYISDLHA